MQKWEYWWFRAEIDGTFTLKNKKGKEKEVSTDQYLNQLGSEGWELVTATKTATGTNLSFRSEHTFFFKRLLGK